MAFPKGHVRGPHHGFKAKDEIRFLNEFQTDRYIQIPEWRQGVGLFNTFRIVRQGN